MPPPTSQPIRHAAIWGLGAIGTLLAAHILPRLRPGETLRAIADAPRAARYRAAPPTFNGTPLALDFADPAADAPPPPPDRHLVAPGTPAPPGGPRPIKTLLRHRPPPDPPTPEPHPPPLHAPLPL